MATKQTQINHFNSLIPIAIGSGKTLLIRDRKTKFWLKKD